MSEHPNAHKVTTNNQETLHGYMSKINSSVGLKNIISIPELKILYICHEGDNIEIHASASRKTASCPYCGHKSISVHSHYTRCISDLPIQGQPTKVVLYIRKMFCKNKYCKHKTFAEQPGAEVFRYRRLTRRCELHVVRQGLIGSSEDASRILSRSGIKISGSSVLRDLHRTHVPDYENIGRIGVDDWAQRKGVTYGSIVVSLEGRHPIDILGDRKMKSFREWLEEHPQVFLVSRDRSTEYSSAIAASGRPVREVADKFHLVKNIMERTMKLVDEHYGEYRAAVIAKEDSDNESYELAAPTIVIQEKTLRKEKVGSRLVKFNEVKELQRKGFKPATIAKKLGIARQTATKFCRQDKLQPWNSKHRNEYEEFDKYVEEQYAEKGELLPILHDLRDKGFTGSQTPFYDHYRYLRDGHCGSRAKFRKEAPKTQRPRDDRPVLIPVRQIGVSIGNAIRNRADAKELKTIQFLLEFDWFREMYEATKEFYSIITGTDSCRLIRWMKKYWKTKIRTLKTFLTGVKFDYRAILNTIKENVTNGITEGFVNKLKAVKRTMYGRASIKLLRRKMVLEHIFFN